MSNTIFFIVFILLCGGMYLYVSSKWKKREKEFDKFSNEMQREFIVNTPSLKTGIDFYVRVQRFYEAQGYSLNKHPDFPTDYIAKKGKEILFIRIQDPQNTQSITAQLFQTFVGQTVMYAFHNPLYASYELKWAYVCSKMMCDRTAKIYINKYEDKLKFELIKED